MQLAASFLHSSSSSRKSFEKYIEQHLFVLPLLRTTTTAAAAAVAAWFGPEDSLHNTSIFSQEETHNIIKRTLFLGHQGCCFSFPTPVLPPPQCTSQACVLKTAPPSLDPSPRGERLPRRLAIGFGLWECVRGRVCFASPPLPSLSFPPLLHRLLFSMRAFVSQ